MLALELPKWVIKAIDRRRGFLWAGKESTNGGKCLVAWDKVARPLQYGGLCISNLQMMSLSLRVRWLWLEKIDAPRPWAALPLPVSNKEKAFFHMAVETVVGNGENTLFWKDCWLGGQSIQELGPNLSMLISTRVSKRTVAQGLVARWVRDIRGALTVPVIIEFLKLWEILDEFGLQPGVDDQHKWRLEQDGSYSSRSAYKACFQGSIRFVPWKLAWKTWAPLSADFLCGWYSRIGVGQLIGSKNEDYLILWHVLYVTKKLKPFNTSCCRVSLPGKYGLLSFKSWGFHHWFRDPQMTVFCPGGADQRGRFPRIQGKD
jgi:hypothetical protein